MIEDIPRKKTNLRIFGKKKRGYRAHRNHTPSNTSFRVKITREIKSIEKKINRMQIITFILLNVQEPLLLGGTVNLIKSKHTSSFPK